jgi:hypothetical protein
MVDAVTARQTLSEVSGAVQSQGWHFNTEVRLKLLSSTFTKEISLPLNFLRDFTAEFRGNFRRPDGERLGSILNSPWLPKPIIKM